MGGAAIRIRVGGNRQPLPHHRVHIGPDIGGGITSHVSILKGAFGSACPPFANGCVEIVIAASICEEEAPTCPGTCLDEVAPSQIAKDRGRGLDDEDHIV
jgi:hypothetical protein